MEEKFIILEGLGGMKGLLLHKKWYGTKHFFEATKTSCRNTECNFSHPKDAIKFQKSEGREINILKNEQIQNWNEDSSMLIIKGKVKEKEENLGKSDFIMEENSFGSEILKKNSAPKDVDDSCLVNKDCPKLFTDLSKSKEKTDESDNLFHESLIILSEVNNLHSGDKIFSTFNEFEGGEDLFHSKKIIPNEKDTSTVQEWVNHLPSKEECLKNNTDCGESKNENQEVSTPVTEDVSLIAAKLSREASVQSNSSLDSLLDSRRPDPVEIFLNLGFGGVPGVNMENCRIPKRFLVPSKCKGGDWNEFLRRELIQAQNFECSSLGFRGLSGPSYRRPSAIVANIMEKLRERAVSSPHPRSRFSSVAKRVLNEKSVLNKLTSESQSVLSPDSRRFLQNQGKISPEVPRRRIIFGQKSFAFAHDGEFIEVESSGGDRNTDKKNVLAPNNDADEPAIFTSPEVLLKLRRSSLQKQKNVEDDSDDNVFYIVEKDEHSLEAESSRSANNTCSKKTEKIPRRFFSSTNLKALEKENDNSDTMRLEVEKEIKTLSEKIKNISNQDLASVLEQVKQLRSKLESATPDASEL